MIKYYLAFESEMIKELRILSAGALSSEGRIHKQAQIEKLSNTRKKFTIGKHNIFILWLVKEV